MKLQQVRLLRREQFEVRLRSGDLPPLEPEAEVELLFGEVGDLIELRSGNHRAVVEGVKAAHSNILWNLRSHARTNVTLVDADVNAEGTRRLSLLNFTFLSEYNWPDLRFALSEAVRRGGPPRRAQEDVVKTNEWFQEQCRLQGESGRYLVTRIPGRHRERSAFRLLGEQYMFDIQEDHEGHLAVTRISQYSKRQDATDSPILLLHADFQLVEPASASSVHDLHWEEADASLGSQQEYLRLWEQYNDLELKLTLAKAAEFGALRYLSVKETPAGGYRLVLKRSQRTDEQLKEIEGELHRYQVDLSQENPPNLVQQGELTDTARAWVKRTRAWTGRVTAVNADTIVVQQIGNAPRARPPEKGFVYPTLSGDIKQIERRKRAYDQILRGAAGMPGLYKLLEGQQAVTRRTSRFDVRDDLVREAFGGTPTARQREALFAALNTPDIALIQGPPGTGKTRVIAALQKLLAHHHKVGGSQSTRARVLITSGQHDAVENVASAIEVYGLPAVKVGRSQRQMAEPVSEHINHWRLNKRDEIGDELTRRGGEPRGIERAIQDVQALLEGYTKSRHVNELPLDLMRQALSIARPFLDEATINEVQSHVARVGAARPSAVADEDLEDAIAAVRRLRTRPSSFEDDGSRRAAVALKELAALGVAGQEEILLLEKAAHAADDPSQLDLEALGTLQEQLLTRMTSGQGLEIQEVHYGEVDTVRRILLSLNRRAEVEEATVDGALQRFLDDLEFDVEGVRQAVETYTMVVASTCQHSVSSEMFNLKEQENTFQTVIVDEAARVSPLDLLIPMSLATQNIILVGDHRQLPHLLEPAVERQLSEEEEEESSETLKLSLFEKLFGYLKVLQEKDRIPRVVTLADQYRMHPTLGRFLSKTFYEPFGEAFDSPRPASDFSQRLPGYEGKCAAWLDVPHRLGGEERRGTSYARVSEGRAIAEEVARLFTWMRDHQEWYSVGVIAFYSAQEPELWKALIDLGIAERDAQGQYGPRDAYRTIMGQNGKHKEGLRVGTVDAFQGKEFDVVFVSMTRSNTVDPVDPEGIRRKYGHLTLPNRLCVAMSRQHRLLIFAGDRSMVTPHVPALHAFDDLVKEESRAPR